MQLYNHYYDEEEKRAKPIPPLTKGGQGGSNTSHSSTSPTPPYEGGQRDDKRLAYIDYKPINRCPHCQTGLANEDLEDGKCERCGSEVEQRPMRQWVLRITKYADRLLEGLDELEWDESMKELERNWIGKSSGTEFRMDVVDNNPSSASSSQASTTLPLPSQGDKNKEIPTFSSPDRGMSEGQGVIKQGVLFFEVYTTRIDTVF